MGEGVGKLVSGFAGVNREITGIFEKEKQGGFFQTSGFANGVAALKLAEQ